jgi:type III pantothenate kinase
MGCGLILADLGNSRVKWGRAEQGRLLPGEAFPTDGAMLADQLDRRWSILEPPEAVYAANVAGADMAERLADWVDARWGVPLRFARAEAECCGVVNGYEDPKQLGVDRWVGLIALKQHYSLPACLVDCGTALTFDVLDAGGRHLGGWIAPGPALMKRALLRETRGIGAVEGGAGEWLGRNTAAGVAGGVLRACAGLVEKSLRETTDKLECRLTLVLTGGDGEAVGRCLDTPYRFDGDLILKGLLTLAENDS